MSTKVSLIVVRARAYSVVSWLNYVAKTGRTLLLRERAGQTDHPVVGALFYTLASL